MTRADALRRLAVLGAGLVVMTTVSVTCSADQQAVCREFADDIENVASEAVSAAGTSSRDDLPPDQVDALFVQLGTSTYEVEVHRDQLGCDRRVLEEQVCPELLALQTKGPVGDELVATLEKSYDCEE